MNRRAFMLSALALLPLAWPKKPTSMTAEPLQVSTQPKLTHADWPGGSFHIREMSYGRVIREYDIVVDDDGKAHLR
jgi:hypothetical protein